MKFIFIPILLFSYFSSFSQNNSDIKSFITNKSFLILDEENTFDFGNNLIKILNKNIFQYFNLEDEYSTPLKKLNFSKTVEYKKLQDSLIKVKFKLKDEMYVKFNPTNNHPRYSVYDNLEKLEYNIKKKGFDIHLGINVGINPSLNYSIGRLIFTNLKSNMINHGSHKDFKIFIPINEIIGGKIEDNNFNSNFFIFFKSTNLIRSFSSYPGEPKSDYLHCTITRIIFTHKDEIIYNKIFN